MLEEFLKYLFLFFFFSLGNSKIIGKERELFGETFPIVLSAFVGVLERIVKMKILC